MRDVNVLVIVVYEKSDSLEKLAFDSFLGLAVALFFREEYLQRRANLNFVPCNYIVVYEKSGLIKKKIMFG